MKGKTFLILLVVAGVLGALAYFRFSDGPQTGGTKMGQTLFDDLPVNQVASVTLADGDNRVTLVKGEKIWQVEQRSGYPADFDQLRDTVVKLSRLKIGRSFTGSTQSLTRLSLLAPSAEAEEGRGTRMTLKDSAGKVLADVILGQVRQTDGGGSGGQYLKKADDDTVFLVDSSFRFLKTAPTEWLQDEILDIKADNVAAVACYTGETPDPVYTLARPEKGQAAQMSPIPSGRTADSEKVDQVFDALAPLTLDDVALADDVKKADGPGDQRLVYRLYDGRQITLFPESDGKENYRVRLLADEIAAETAGNEKVETVAAANPEQDQESGSGASKGSMDEKGAVVKTVKQINDELGPWVFSIKKWQFDSLITQPDDLLEAVEEKADQSS